ncbi:SMP-30/gluconolactonase/LRE family protein [Pendulispora albinea]|uniref:SMP-30/Gluconolactonase/LRE-like region domain-containing protein n=1 Tax=Pendulispora albinea TaxID=2741071 RepID=A0ABZ2M497_9BACT
MSDPEISGDREPLQSGCGDSRTGITVPGEDFFPEGVAVAPDGSFYIGSFQTGAIARARPGADAAEPFIAGRSNFYVAGVTVDTRRRTLWACVSDDDLLPEQAAYLHGYDLRTGALTAKYVLPGVDGFCNDVILDDRGNVYATDAAANTVVRLRSGGTKLETWSNDPLFQPGPGPITLNGIVFDRRRHRLLVVKSDSGDLLSVPIRSDGSAGAARIIPVDPPLQFPDGIEMADDDTLIIGEHRAGNVVSVTIDGARGRREVLRSGLAQPTTSALYRGSAWVVISQLRAPDGHPTLPFRLERIPLPSRR